MRTFRLGGGRARSLQTDRLRGGELAFESPRGLARETALLIEALVKEGPGRALFGMDSEGAVALAAAELWAETEVHWFHLDAYVARKVESVLTQNLASDVTVHLAEDPPEGPFGCIALGFGRDSERLLRMDLLEAAHAALEPGGRLIVAAAAGGATLRELVKRVFGNVTPAATTGRGSRRKGKGACFYATRKRAEARVAERSHILTPTFGVGEAAVSLELETRPGTFSHGSLDRGTRAMGEWWRPSGEATVLDLGAGCGALGLLTAKALPEARVVLVDSHARACACAQRNAERNGVADRVEVLLRADLEGIPMPEGGFDLVLANPPYFSDLRIPRAFARSAAAHLSPSGRTAFVGRLGRAANLQADVLRERFERVDLHEVGDYQVSVASKVRDEGPTPAFG